MSNVFDQFKPEPQVLRLAGPFGWLRNYVEWARQQTSAAEEFHLGVGLGVLAATIGEEVTYHAWSQVWSPNLYVLLLGASGAKKSTALNLGKNIYELATQKRTLPKTITSTSLFTAFEGDRSQMWAHSELAAFLSTLTNEYNRDLKTRLTDIYDGEELSALTKTDGVRRVKPTLTILAASNAEWLTGYLKENDVAGGFLPRFTFFPGLTVGEERLDWNDPPKKQEHGALISDLRQIHQQVGGVVKHGAVRDRISEWFIAHKKYSDALRSSDIRLSPFMERFPHLLIKLTVLMQVSMYGTLDVREDAVEAAIGIVLFLRDGLERMVLEQLTFDKFARGARMIVESLQEGGPMTRAAIHRNVQAVLPTSEDLDKSIRALESRDEIKLVRVKVKTNTGKEVERGMYTLAGEV